MKQKCYDPVQKKKLPKTLELFVSGSFHLIFSAYSWMKT